MCTPLGSEACAVQTPKHVKYSGTHAASIDTRPLVNVISSENTAADNIGKSTGTSGSQHGVLPMKVTLSVTETPIRLQHVVTPVAVSTAPPGGAAGAAHAQHPRDVVLAWFENGSGTAIDVFTGSTCFSWSADETVVAGPLTSHVYQPRHDSILVCIGRRGWSRGVVKGGWSRGVVKRGVVKGMEYLVNIVPQGAFMSEGLPLYCRDESKSFAVCCICRVLTYIELYFM